jgi:hypothetical protein
MINNLIFIKISLVVKYSNQFEGENFNLKSYNLKIYKSNKIMFFVISRKF